MSLLDDVSIVVTPNGYKAGELYAVVPVPTEGAEEVTNGDFATDSDWIKAPSGVTISGGSANFNLASDTYVYQDILTATKTYKITFSGTINSGSLYIGENGVATNIYTSGTYTNEVAYFKVASSVRFIIRKTGLGTLDATIDNVSVKEYTAADMDVTRATAATRVDEDGLVNYAEIIGSELVTCGDFSCATPSTYWTATNAVISFDNNQLTVDDTAGAGGDSRGSQTITTENGKTYRLTFDRISTTSLFYLGVGSGAGYNDIFYSNLGTDTGEYTLEFTATSSSTTIAFISGGNGITVFSSISVKEVTRDNVPRIDYTGGGCPHILAEPQRTNTVTYSEDFSQFATSGSPTLTTGQLSPSGEYNATKISGTIGSTYLALSGTTSATATRTIYAKTVSGTGTARLMSYFGNTDNLFNLTEEWQRFELTGAISTGAANFYVDMRGTQTLNEFIVWGGQSEEATYATSYIPTSGSTVTRNQDIFTRDGIGSLINSEGVLFAEMAAFSNDGTNRKIALSDGTGSNLVRFYFSNSSNRVVAQVKVGGSTQVTFDITGITVTNFNKVALKYKENDFAIWINGVERGTDTSGTTPSSMNKIAFDNGAGSDYFYGKVRQLQVYNTALTDEQLLQLTGTSGTDFYESYAEMASALTYTIQ